MLVFECCDQVIVSVDRFQLVSHDTSVISDGPDESPEIVGAGLRSRVLDCVGVFLRWAN